MSNYIGNSSLLQERMTQVTRDYLQPNCGSLPQGIPMPRLIPSPCIDTPPNIVFPQEPETQAITVIRNQHNELSQLYKERESDLRLLTQVLVELERIKAKSHSAKVEVLSVSGINGSLVLNKGDESGKILSSIPFINANIRPTVAFYDTQGQMGVCVEILVCNTERSVVTVVISAVQLKSEAIVDLVLLPGVRYLAKLSKKHRATLLQSYIISEIQKGDLSRIRQHVKWYIENERLIYVDGYRKRPFDSVEMDKKKLVRRKGMLDNNKILAGVIELFHVFKDSSYGALLLLTCVGGFLRSLLFINCWCPELVLCFCGNHVNVRIIVDKYLAIWENGQPEILSAKMPERDFLQRLSQNDDEPIIIDCGEEVTNSAYKEKQRKSNIRIVTEWGNYDNRCFPLLVSNNLVDICRVENVLPLVIGREDIQWEVWEKVQKCPYIVHDFIHMLCEYIETTGTSFQEWLNREANCVYSQMQQSGQEHSCFVALYKTLAKFLCMIADLKGSDYEITQTFKDDCNEAVSLLMTVTAPHDMIISEFKRMMDNLVDEGILEFCNKNRKINKALHIENCLYYDDQYLYMSMEIFCDTILFHLNEPKKNAAKVLSELAQDGIVYPYQNSRDFCVDLTISFGEERKRISLLRFKRDSFYTIGKPDIVIRGREYNGD